MRIALSVSAFLGAVLLGGCSSGRSCKIGTTYCIDFTGSGYLVGTAASDFCTAIPSTTYSSTASCAASTLGSCKVLSGQPLELSYKFYTAYGTAATAQTFCEASSGGLSGVWTAN